MKKADEVNQQNVTPQTEAEYRAALGTMLEEMKRANARMDENYIEIARLRAETRLMLDELPRLLSR